MEKASRHVPTPHQASMTLCRQGGFQFQFLPAFLGSFKYDSPGFFSSFFRIITATFATFCFCFLGKSCWISCHLRLATRNAYLIYCHGSHVEALLG